MRRDSALPNEFAAPGLPLAGRDRINSALLQALKHERWDRLMLTARGESMSPLIRSGDRLTVIGRAPRLGELVVFSRQDRLVVHRLVGFWRRGAERLLLTRGDNQPGADDWVTTREVVGAVVGWRRGGRGVRESRMMSFLRTLRSVGGYALARIRQCTD